MRASGVVVGLVRPTMTSVSAPADVPVARWVIARVTWSTGVRSTRSFRGDVGPCRPTGVGPG